MRQLLERYDFKYVKRLRVWVRKNAKDGWITISLERKPKTVFVQADFNLGLGIETDQFNSILDLRRWLDSHLTASLRRGNAVVV